MPNRPEYNCKNYEHPATVAADVSGCRKGTCHGKINRRTLLGVGAIGAAAIGYPLARRLLSVSSPVFLARNQRYDGALTETIAAGLSAVGFDSRWVRGRRVLLKPNLVEPLASAPQISTHPAVVVAAAELFRRWGAEVTVGEAPANIRDTEMALVESGMTDALRGEKLPFLDLNYDEFRRVPNAGRCSALREFSFPSAVLDADLIVSMPKLKTHHWIGLTASMKNMYGVLPGLVYGWPKNVLHYAGIPETVVDINASLPPRIAIVDGILCMEGDGPILGTPKPLGLLAVGMNLAAVDATLARIAGFDPHRVPYLAMADGRIGPLAERSIIQRGERWADVASSFSIVDLPHLQAMRP
ncbi:MAG: DUF362 domain-containing protein [Planctomycetaceae bacterium]|nr:DUF362 domain-containing protein [Planctomycetaceae bacterium]